ncbi:MAG TPA: MaoC family dehydratase [Gemmatimonadaceae bacterium]|nr:MaoC family dehydratase [Gemmatimonadaceae bacterium]
MKFADLSVGQSAERTKEMTEALVNSYAELTGDFSPVHVDEAAAKQTRFGTRIAHGMLSAGFLSAVIGMDLPGPGTIWVAQALKFKQPVKLGDTITWRVEIKELFPEKKRATLSTICRNQRGEKVIDGEGTILLLE